VQAAQLLLIARGWRCGPWGADGDFGAATYGAVYRFQQGKQLLLDGEIGPETWSALIGERE
jgi:peptidoglycan hydrolase-like protein with peptidoglycan-binding domain